MSSLVESGSREWRDGVEDGSEEGDSGKGEWVEDVEEGGERKGGSH